MSLYKDIKSKEEKVSVIGLEYVGMPLAIAFAKKVNVIGFDINSEKMSLYLQKIDPTGEIEENDIKNNTIKFTNDEKDLRGAKFHIIAMPTLINTDKTPNLFPVENASKIIWKKFNRWFYCCL